MACFPLRSFAALELSLGVSGKSAVGVEGVIGDGVCGGVSMVVGEGVVGGVSTNGARIGATRG